MRGKVWRFLHAETEAEADAILRAESSGDEPAVQKDLIEEMRNMRALLGPKPQAE